MNAAQADGKDTKLVTGPAPMAASLRCGHPGSLTWPRDQPAA
jgi:hypothetical protein